MAVIDMNVVTVIEDTDDRQGWDRITLTHDPFGQLLASVIELDSGSIQSRQFTDGLLRSLVVTDTTANDADWSLRTTLWDEFGSKTSRTTLKDNGIRVVENYDTITGLRVERTEYDDANKDPWLSKSVSYDAVTGNKVETRKIMNNGWVYEEKFDPATGNRISKSEVDAADKRNWQEIETGYDATTGEIVTRTWTFDNGMIRQLSFEGGKLVTKTKMDTGDVTDWLTRELHFDDSGKLSQRDVTYDDGSSSSETRVDGVRTEMTLVDGEGGADQFEWKTRTEYYHDGGPVSRIVDVLDDGDLVETTYRVDKSLSSRTTTDVSGDEIWHVEKTTYDESGALLSAEYYDALGNLIFF